MRAAELDGDGIAEAGSGGELVESAFQSGWFVVAGASLLAALAGATLLRPARAAPRSVPVGAEAC
ncbi:MAG: hypothetical protein ABI323_12840 [Solirubrobacteraceae bacterium]